MKKLLLTAAIAISTQFAVAQKSYEPSWESISQYEIPDWALDAKFGLYATWGPYAITGSWDDNTVYPTNGNTFTVGYRTIYGTDENDQIRKSFEKRYGKVKDGHGYYDLCKDFTIPKFDPVAWAELAKESGAKYAGACAVHHDGYLLWDSDVTSLNSADLGAKRDVIGELFTELEKRNIKTVASFHHARTRDFFGNWSKNLSKRADYQNCDLVSKEGKERYWFLGTEEEFAEKELAITNELVNRYKPDIIWFDGGATRSSKEMIANFLNMGEREGKEVVLHNKDRMFGDDFGVYSYERGYLRPHSLLTHPWEDDDSASICGSWCWWHGIDYKPYQEIVKRLCHLTAINGGLLLSLNVRPDGGFDPKMVEMLKGIGAWLKQNGEAIHGTRPWKIQGEGHMDELELRYVWSQQMQWRYATPNTYLFKSNDFRFTTKENNLFALQLGIPTGKTTAIKSLSNKNRVSSINKIKSIELLGYGKVDFKRTDDALVITLPNKMPNNIALAYKIEVEGELTRILYEGKR